LANLFGFTAPDAGGVVCQGGSSSNHTSLVIARNTLFPETKTQGNGTRRFALFTSSHGHYSVEKSALSCGMGTEAVVSIPVDGGGRMIPAALREAIAQARGEGKTPLYVNATAGTTVMGSFDPLEEIADICAEFGLWMHVDASWGGPAIFSDQQKEKLRGSARANSLTVNPHKMMSVPVTCSFLLTNDTAIFHRANSLPAAYLFHGGGDADEVWDLADLTLQCGRRGDALKLALAWVYYGADGLGRQIDHAFEMAAYLAELVAEHEDFELVSTRPPPCLQVCFYSAPGGVLGSHGAKNTTRTREMAARLIGRGFMIDHAPGEHGNFFRVVVNCQTLKGTVEGLVMAMAEVGQQV
jgi:glutamate decarboxylase